MAGSVLHEGQTILQLFPRKNVAVPTESQVDWKCLISVTPAPNSHRTRDKSAGLQGQIQNPGGPGVKSESAFIKIRFTPKPKKLMENLSAHEPPIFANPKGEN